MTNLEWQIFLRDKVAVGDDGHFQVYDITGVDLNTLPNAPTAGSVTAMVQNRSQLFQLYRPHRAICNATEVKYRDLTVQVVKGHTYVIVEAAVVRDGYEQEDVPSELPYVYDDNEDDEPVEEHIDLSSNTDIVVLHFYDGQELRIELR